MGWDKASTTHKQYKHRLGPAQGNGVPNLNIGTILTCQQARARVAQWNGISN